MSFLPPNLAAFVPPLLGGLLIGASTSLLLLTRGRIAGISGVLGGVVIPAPGGVVWRLQFLVGLLLGGLVAVRLMPGAFGDAPPASWALTIGAGLLVGFGTRLSNGCTSGHGVCGLPRFSLRSLVATMTFMGAGALTVLATHHLG